MIVTGRSDSTQQLTSFGNVEGTDEDFIDLNVGCTSDLMEVEEDNFLDDCEQISDLEEDGGDVDIDCHTTRDHNYAQSDDNRLSDDGMEYLTGFVCHKTNQVVSEEFDAESWVAKVSEGGLKIPDRVAKGAARHLEKIFQQTNGQRICEKPGIINRMLKRADKVDISLKFKKLYLRSRLYFRLRFLNRLNTQNIRDKRKKRMNKLKKTIE